MWSGRRGSNSHSQLGKTAGGTRKGLFYAQLTRFRSQIPPLRVASRGPWRARKLILIRRSAAAFGCGGPARVRFWPDGHMTWWLDARLAASRKGTA